MILAESCMRLVLALVLLLWATSPSPQSSVYTVNLPEDYSVTDGREVLDNLAKAIYAPFFPVKTEVYPTARAFKMLSKGQIDADLARLERTMRDKPYMIRVPTPLIQVDVGYFCIKRDDCYLDQPFVIVPKGFEAGIEYCNKHFKNCLSVYNHTNAFRALRTAHADVLLGTTLSVVSVLCDIDFTDTIYYRKVPELSLPAYHYVHRKHESLVAFLDAKILEFKDNGTIQRILDTYWKTLEQCEVLPIELENRFIESLEN